jgi:putative ABC transport system substrate-binding protein
VERGLWRGLEAAGYVVSQTLVIERRCFERPEDATLAVNDLLARHVDLLVVWAAPAALAAKRATSTKPIVFIAVEDPVGVGLVASLSKPGGNATGLTGVGTDIAEKKVQLLLEAVPRAKRIGVLMNPENKGNVSQVNGTQAAASKLHLTLETLRASTPSELAQALSRIDRHRLDALVVSIDTLFFVHQQRIAEAVSRARVPAVFPLIDFVQVGGLMSYAADLVAMSQRAATYVDKILKGAKPGDLPVEQPTKFELVINLKTAKALGLTIPQSLLLRADQVIE